MKKMLAIMAGFIILGFALAAAQDTTKEPTKAQAQAKAQLKAKGEVQQNKVQTKAEFRHRINRPFVDENGDGINDLAKDADGDGIPNGQDPDWVKPEDGTGYKEQNRNGAAGKAVSETASGYQLARDDDGDGVPNGQDPDWTKPLDGSGYKDQHRIGKGSFRTGTMAAGRATGTGGCDGTGPKGSAQRKGRR